MRFFGVGCRDGCLDREMPLNDPGVVWCGLVGSEVDCAKKVCGMDVE